MTCGISAAVGLCSVVPLRTGSAECRSVVESITSNNVRLLTGSGDTLWMLTERGVNFTADFGEHWRGYDFSCRGDRALDIAYGGGRGAAILQSDERAANRLWFFESGTGKTGEGSIAYPDPDAADSVSLFYAWDICHLGSAFWIALLDGGIAQWVPGGSARAYLVGSSKAYSPGRSKPFAGLPDTSRRVIGVSAYQSDSVAELLVCTPSRLWRFSPPDSSWDTSITNSLAGHQFVTFESVIQSPDSLLYAYVTVKAAGGKNQTLLFRYDEAHAVWRTVLTSSPRGISFAGRGFFYTIHGKSSLSLYRDTAGDSSVVPLSRPVLDTNHFESKMVQAALSAPDSLNDVFFSQINDSAGHLWIATSEGLFLARGHVPGTASDTLRSIRYALAVKTGLKQTYAVPGILRYDEYGRWGSARFVYNLSKDARVTIGVYDYNMDFVKYVIVDAPRRAVKDPSKRSSLSTDVWDGTGAGGRRVAPGVYYYKITTSSGERAIGKVIVAKD